MLISVNVYFLFCFVFLFMERMENIQCLFREYHIYFTSTAEYLIFLALVRNI